MLPRAWALLPLRLRVHGAAFGCLMGLDLGEGPPAWTVSGEGIDCQALPAGRVVGDEESAPPPWPSSKVVTVPRTQHICHSVVLALGLAFCIRPQLPAGHTCRVLVPMSAKALCGKEAGWGRRPECLAPWPGQLAKEG